MLAKEVSNNAITAIGHAGKQALTDHEGDGRNGGENLDKEQTVRASLGFLSPVSTYKVEEDKKIVEPGHPNYS